MIPREICFSGDEQKPSSGSLRRTKTLSNIHLKGLKCEDIYDNRPKVREIVNERP